MRPHSALDMTDGGKIGCQQWPLKRADREHPGERAVATGHLVTARNKTATQITVTLTYQEPVPRPKR